jgi:hypothetical protein
VHSPFGVVFVPIKKQKDVQKKLKDPKKQNKKAKNKQKRRKKLKNQDFPASLHSS